MLSPCSPPDHKARPRFVRSDDHCYMFTPGKISHEIDDVFILLAEEFMTENRLLCSHWMRLAHRLMGC